MLTLYKTAAECDFLPGIAEPPNNSALRTPAATFGLEAFNTGILARYYHETHGWVLAMVCHSGDTFYCSYDVNEPWSGARAHDDFLSAAKYILSMCFIVSVDIQDNIIRTFHMELM